MGKKCLDEIMAILQRLSEEQQPTIQFIAASPEVDPFRMITGPESVEPPSILERVERRPSRSRPSRLLPKPLSTLSESKNNYLVLPVSPVVQKYGELIETWKATPSGANVSTPSVNSTASSPLKRTDTAVTRIKIYQTMTQIQLASQLTVSHIKSDLLSDQLSLIEQDLFRQIFPEDIIKHNPPSAGVPEILASTDFFNHVCRMVEWSVLEPESPEERAARINDWIKVAFALGSKRNYQTLKAVVSALNTPPIVRLRKTWQQVPKKSLAVLKILIQNTSEDDNFKIYRSLVQTGGPRPTIPYIGVILHDVAYLKAAMKKDPTAENRLKDIYAMMGYFQEGPRYADVTRQSGKRNGLKGNLRGDLRVLYLLDYKEMQALVAHWILSQQWKTEKQVDELSQQREPRSGDAPVSPQERPKSRYRNGFLFSMEANVDFEKARECLASNGLPVFEDKYDDLINSDTAKTGTGESMNMYQRSSILDSIKRSSRREKSVYSAFFDVARNVDEYVGGAGTGGGEDEKSDASSIASETTAEKRSEIEINSYGGSSSALPSSGLEPKSPTLATGNNTSLPNVSQIQPTTIPHSRSREDMLGMGEKARSFVHLPTSETATTPKMKKSFLHPLKTLGLAIKYRSSDELLGASPTIRERRKGIVPVCLDQPPGVQGNEGSSN